MPLSNPFHASLRVAIPMAAAILGGCQSEPDRSDAPAAPTVRVARAVLSDSASDLSATGTLEASVSVAATFRTAGTVQKVLVNEGQSVRRDEPLAELESGSLRDQLLAAQAKARQAEDAWTRLKPLHENGTVPDVKWVEVETGREQARSMVSVAARNLDDALLRSPLAGIVARRSIEPGEQSAPGTPAFTLVQTGTMLAGVPVAEKDVAKLRVGTPARVRVDAVGREVAGKVREIGVEADPLTRTYKVKVAIPNPDELLRVGMVAQVRLHVPGSRPCVVVPTTAVFVDAAGRNFAWIETQGKVRRRTVRVSGFLQDAVAVDSGLAAGEGVVVSGTPMLHDGAPVRVGN